MTERVLCLWCGSSGKPDDPYDGGLSVNGLCFGCQPGEVPRHWPESSVGDVLASVFWYRYQVYGDKDEALDELATAIDLMILTARETRLNRSLDSLAKLQTELKR